MEVFFEEAYDIHLSDITSAGYMIDEYERWLLQNNIPFEFVEGPFYIEVDKKYSADLLAFKLVFGL